MIWSFFWTDDQFSSFRFWETNTWSGVDDFSPSSLMSWSFVTLLVKKCVGIVGLLAEESSMFSKFPTKSGKYSGCFESYSYSLKTPATTRWQPIKFLFKGMEIYRMLPSNIMAGWQQVPTTYKSANAIPTWWNFYGKDSLWCKQLQILPLLVLYQIYVLLHEKSILFYIETVLGIEVSLFFIFPCFGKSYWIIQQ